MCDEKKKSTHFNQQWNGSELIFNPEIITLNGLLVSFFFSLLIYISELDRKDGFLKK